MGKVLVKIRIMIQFVQEAGLPETSVIIGK
jgi:hypothetical protein